MSDRRRLSLLLVLALVLILGAYYWVHKPLAPESAAALAAPLADLSAALLLALLAGGLGRRILRGWLITSPGERAALDAALGWGVLALVALGLGFANLYYSTFIWILTLAALPLLWRELGGWLADVLRALRGMWPPDRGARLAGLFALFALGLGLLRALAPPLMWDALVYHLALPKLYAESHSLRLSTEIMFSGMPQLAEMLYTAAILLRGPIAAQALGWAIGAVLALGLAAHATEALGARFAALAPAILFSSFTVAQMLAWAYADLLLMLFALSMLIALRYWRLHGDARWLWLGGAFAGFAVGCKYTGALVPLAGAAVSALTASHLVTVSPRHLVRFLLIALLAFSPWLLKNLAFTGNPVYPLLIPTPAMDGLRLWFYARPDLVDPNPLNAALVFFRAVFLGVQGGNTYEATLGPLWVALPLVLLAGWRRLDHALRAELQPLVIFVLAAYAGWVLLNFTSALAVQARLFFPAFPALALLGVGGLTAAATLDTPRLRTSFVVNAALAIVLALSAFELGAAFARRSPLAYLIGAQSPADYRAANLGWYAVAVDHVNALPAGSRVKLLWETRSLECAGAARCDPDVIIDRWWHARRALGSAEAILAAWRAEGATHILIYDDGLNFVRADPRSGLAGSDWAELDVLRGKLRLIANIGGAYSLYALP